MKKNHTERVINPLMKTSGVCPTHVSMYDIHLLRLLLEFLLSKKMKHGKCEKKTLLHKLHSFGWFLSSKIFKKLFWRQISPETTCREVVSSTVQLKVNGLLTSMKLTLHLEHGWIRIQPSHSSKAVVSSIPPRNIVGSEPQNGVNRMSGISRVERYDSV